MFHASTLLISISPSSFVVSGGSSLRGWGGVGQPRVPPVSNVSGSRMVHERSGNVANRSIKLSLGNVRDGPFLWAIGKSIGASCMVTDKVI
ncbi:hypothetical protein VNO78_30400 [Psophocarpus tetragonolobus]|uniref:Uncharacterized protein n=1 Tax=Psophocarpus tetragonolobus TaxID=3891 RepID=A0AAN9RXT3_PSOTE